MKIAILTLGTRGDVQPYAVLGQALMHHGHQVTLSTAANFEKLVTSYGISFLPVEADFQAILESDEGKKMMKGNPLAVRRNLHTWIYPLITDSLEKFYILANESDVVLYHVKTLADSFADQFPHKMIRASVVPVTEPTQAFANPSFSGIYIPRFLYRWSYRLANFSIKLLSKPIGAFRAKFDLPHKYSPPIVRNIYGISPSFLPVPDDYPPSSVFTGFWFGQSQEALSPELHDFLSAGAPPLLLTFGSMPFKTTFDIQSAILKISGQYQIRIIVVKGWGLDQTENLEQHPNIKVINGAPYEKLFPLVKAVIHHGGIGTTAECLRAGKPCMICPILYPIGDQQFWGQMAYKKGFGVRPIPLGKMKEQEFADSIATLLTDMHLYENARKIKHLIDSEDGLTNAVNIIVKIRC